MKVDGGCQCGALAYEAEVNPERVSICHCSDCQKLSGSAFVVYAVAREENFRLTAGRLEIYLKQADSGNERQLAFCPVCSALIYSTSAGEGPRYLALRVGTIRQRAELPPKSQIWWGSALPWVKELIGRDNMPTRDAQ